MAFSGVRTARSSNKAAIHARRAANAAVSAERAYVFAQIFIESVSSRDSQLRVRLVNVGNTPATKIAFSITYRDVQGKNVEISDEKMADFITRDDPLIVFRTNVKWADPKQLIYALTVEIISYTDVFGADRDSVKFEANAYSDLSVETVMI
jgi:hypothetical protein